MPVPPRISLVIPAHNEVELLPRLLDTVDVARQRYRYGAEAIEVIVADNASTDGTAALAAARGCRVAPVTRRVIGAARNGGAAMARAPILCFVDADFQIHPETFTAIESALDDRVVGGATGVTLERWSPGIAATFAVLAPLVLVTGIDTGVVFCRRADFLRVGGYDETRDFLEDVAFLRALSRLGRPRRQRLIRLTSVKAVASTRKFDRYGDWHMFTRMPQVLASLLTRRRGRHAFVRQYWYDDRG